MKPSTVVLIAMARRSASWNHPTVTDDMWAYPRYFAISKYYNITIVISKDRGDLCDH